MNSIIKEKAILLRRSGLSYSQILQEVHVAKSTLSLWLRSVNLSKTQIQRLTDKKLAAAKRGGQVKKMRRLKDEMTIRELARRDIGLISDKELFLLGIILYWAEGAKSKEYNPSQGVIFSNSDPYMIKIIIKWVKTCLSISDDEIYFEIYVHDTYKDQLHRLRDFWALRTGFPISKFDKIYFKRTKLNTKRRNTGDTYYGQLRVKIRKSTNLNRQIAGWAKGIFEQCGVV